MIHQLLFCNIDLASLFCVLLLLDDCLDLQVSSAKINVCPPGWIESFHSRSCLKVFQTQVTWVDGRRGCGNYSADLIKIDEKKRRLFNETSDKRYWTGLNDRGDEGNYHFPDFIFTHEKPKVFHWALGEPNDPKNYTNCVNADLSTVNGWYDENCQKTFGIVCEKFRERVCAGNKFGFQCNYECNTACVGTHQTCDSFSGFCKDGCVPGYKGKRCEYGCTNGTYGAGCTETCSPRCGGLNKDCSPINGTCTFGCDQGFLGETCTEKGENKTVGDGEKKGLEYSRTAIYAFLIFFSTIWACAGLSICLRLKFKNAARWSFAEDSISEMDGNEHSVDQGMITRSDGGYNHHSNFTHEEDGSPERTETTFEENLHGYEESSDLSGFADERSVRGSCVDPLGLGEYGAMNIHPEAPKMSPKEAPTTSPKEAPKTALSVSTKAPDAESL